jgi:hypothetical protein
MFAAKDRRPQDAAVSSRPGTLAAAARFRNSFRQESQKRPSVFSELCTLLTTQKYQRPYFHSLAHSLQQEQILTPVFPITPALFLRSCAQERKSTPLFSCACARFCRYGGGRTVKFYVAFHRVPSRSSRGAPPPVLRPYSR